jgi:hypothetical protein
LGVAGESDFVNADAVALEQTLVHADVERHERKRFRHGFADAQRFFGERLLYRSRADECCSKESYRVAETHGNYGPLLYFPGRNASV